MILSLTRPANVLILSRVGNDANAARGEIMTTNSDNEKARHLAYSRCPETVIDGATLRRSARLLLCVAENLKIAAKHGDALPDQWVVYRDAAAIQDARADRATVYSL